MVETDVEAQPLAVAKALQAIQEKEQAKLVIFGKQSIDGDNAQTGQMFAALTGMSQATFASEIKIEGDKAQVTREIDGGLQTLSINSSDGLYRPSAQRTSLCVPTKHNESEKEAIGRHVSRRIRSGYDPTVEVLSVEPPAEREAGIKVESIEELVDKLKNEAKVIS